MTASGLVCGAEFMSSVSTDTMGRAFRAVALATVAASGAQAFSPAQAFSGLGRPGLRQATSARPTLGLRMSENDVDYKPIIPTPENSMAPDYAKEPTQFERQGLVDSNAPTPKTYGGQTVDGGFGGLTRREVYGTAGAAGAGVVGVLWALTRNPGYDRKSDARSAGKVTINSKAVAAPKIQEAIADLKEVRGSLDSLFATFKKDKNAKLSEGVSEFEITEIRDSLNAITFAAFDEDTQILTDRLSRNIIQVCSCSGKPISPPLRVITGRVVTGLLQRRRERARTRVAPVGSNRHTGTDAHVRQLTARDCTTVGGTDNLGQNRIW